MTAYVECQVRIIHRSNSLKKCYFLDKYNETINFQIMKQIFQGLVALQLHTTWQEIYEFRETHIGK